MLGVKGEKSFSVFMIQVVIVESFGEPVAYIDKQVHNVQPSAAVCEVTWKINLKWNELY